MTMKRLFLTVFVLSASASSFAAPAGESLRAGAEKNFLSVDAACLPLIREIKLVRPEGLELEAANFDVTSPGGDSAEISAAPLMELDLAALYNRHLKSRLAYSLGGQAVWFSGAFDRKNEAYFSIFKEGEETEFYNIRGIYDAKVPKQTTIGANKYNLTLMATLPQIKSEIVLSNAADEDEEPIRVSIKKMLDAVGATGDEVKLSDQVYRVFYFDNLKEEKADKTLQNFAFILTEGNKDIHLFLIPAESVPQSQVATFKMFKNKAVGLQQVAGKLKIYENP